ncbi:MAG TPA: hypothetical protein VFM93_14510 [Candidatus Limnocylindria bacterium]|nr:hypothetical protein [Candidatus Limnocylindria bacterium]
MRSADAVVEARVIERVGTRDVRGYEQQRVPVSFTDSRVRVSNVLKGDVERDLVVAQVGKDGDPAQNYPEFPILRPGADVVLFLVDVSTVAIHAQAPSRYAVIAPVGLLAVDGQRLTSRASGHASSDRAISLTLDQFRQVVRTAAR